MLPNPQDDSNFENNVSNMKYLIETFKPEMSDGTPFLYGTDEEPIIRKLDPKLVWTEIQLDTTCITNGFLSAEKDERVNGYYLCEKPCDEEPISQFVYTEINIECTNCDGEGLIEDEDCGACEANGFVYRYLNEVWPGL